MANLISPALIALLACLGLSACATAPSGSRVQMVGVPLAALHSDIGFTVMGNPKHEPACLAPGSCAIAADADEAKRFAMQAERVTDLLQQGARILFPDLAQRVPGLPAKGFDVYVVAGDEPGTDSSANGRIALNAHLGTLHPYDDWLAFVIAREMGHVIARHHEENSAASIITTMLLNVIIPGSSLVKSAISAGGSGLAAISRRDVQRPEADAIALALLQAAGFRQRDLSLALRIGPRLHDDGTWSTAFRVSSENLQNGIRDPGIAVASVVARIGGPPDARE
jgi:hypothetical protein